MAKLILDSLRVAGFRGFRDLQITRLGRVNLVVGKNNIGKSSLLEALRLYAERGSPNVVRNLLSARDEMRRITRREAVEMEEQSIAVRYLFYGRPDLREPPKPISIGPLNDESETVAISTRRSYALTEEGTQHSMFQIEQGKLNLGDESDLYLSTSLGTRTIYSYSVAGLPRRSSVGPDATGIPDIPNMYVPANGLSRSSISNLWDQTALTDREADILRALRIIAPSVERLAIIGGEYTAERIPIVKISDISSPVPLRNMGEGMNRMFGVALALVNTTNGIFLIDEIESGLHYSVQPDLWRLVFEVTKALDIQVFATSHSWDCIEAFQKAAVADHLAEGMLVRLEMQDTNVVSTLFNERELTIATRHDIEVR